MIAGFDHAVIAVRDLAASAEQYAALLGRAASATETRDGVSTILIQTGNIAIELMAPAGESEAARRLSAAIDDGGEGLKSLVFAVSDITSAHRRAERVGLAPEDIVEREAHKSFRANTERTHGVRLFFMQRQAAPDHSSGADDAVSGLDHVVIRSGAPERTAALYGARLGLDMRLDREVAGRRLMFFRCGGAIVEIVGDESLADGRDRLWGLSWRVRSVDAAQARLNWLGFDVSDVRTGMKPGTRVFTVRNRTNGVPTLIIELSSKRD